jgi:anti-anti-sigma factor
MSVDIRTDPPSQSAALAVDVEVDLDSGAVTAVVSGLIDFSNVARLRRHLLDVVGMTHASNVVVDLTGATMADATGGAALVHALRACRARAIELRLRCDPHSETGRVLGVLGLASLIVPAPAPPHPEDRCLAGQ